MFDRRVRYIRYLCNARFSAKDGLVKQIGVSNYNERHLGELLDYAEIRPMASQFEIHPFNTREKLVQMCQASDKKNSTRKNNQTRPNPVENWQNDA